jgi:CDP-glycerol glycerophosphotransferase (TagB/SpsB family)
VSRFSSLKATSTRVAGRSARQLVSRLSPRRPPSGRPLWVLGASAGLEYCDNVRSIHEYLQMNRPDLEAVWVIDRDSADVNEVSRIGPYVDHRSLAAHRLVRAADVLVFSHGIHDLPGLLSNRRATMARLGHGLTALKQTKGRQPRSLQRMTSRVDLAPVASQFEQANKRTWGFEDHQLPITGLARWDTMQTARADCAESSTVLFALTWRDWISSDNLEASDYWRQMEMLANSDCLAPALQPTGLSVELFTHPLIRRALQPRLEGLQAPPLMITRGAEVPTALARSALLITDYSSLAWDALFLGIPVIFFQFDVDEYLAHRASFVDLRGRLFGPTVRTVSELESAIQSFVGAGLRLPAYEADQARWAETAFAYRDDRNCERIVASIEQVRHR